MELHKHPELKKVLRGQTIEERGDLETKLVREGIREPLVVWNHDGKDYIVDGHNRYEIATQQDLDFMVEYKAFDDVEQAYDWIIDNQLGRRNLTPEQASYYRGKKYNRLKDRPGGYYGNQYTQVANAQFEQKPDTAEQIAAETNVSRATVVRDAEFASALNALVEVSGDEVKTMALSTNLIGKGAAVALKKKLGSDKDGVVEVLRRVTENGEKASTVYKELFPPKDPPKPRDMPATPPDEPFSGVATEDPDSTPAPEEPGDKESGDRFIRDGTAPDGKPRRKHRKPGNRRGNVLPGLEDMEEYLKTYEPSELVEALSDANSLKANAVLSRICAVIDELNARADVLVTIQDPDNHYDPRESRVRRMYKS